MGVGLETRMNMINNINYIEFPITNKHACSLCSRMSRFGVA